MPVIAATDYKPPFFLRNGHLNTIYPFVFRKNLRPPYIRERFTTSDGDFVDLDWQRSGSKRLAILCHGLEGSSDSQYMQYTSSLLAEHDWDVVVFNFRSCSGEMNATLQMYHSGWTTDLHEIIEEYDHLYDHVALIGVSLGGNMILKYTCDGIFAVSDKVQSIVAVSTPADLSASSRKIIARENKAYDKRFRITLIDKMKRKHAKFPDEIPLSNLSKVKTLWDFDHYFTGPLHGFDGAEDYYSRCNSKQFLHKCSRPTLMITAQDDPFLTFDSMVFDIARDIDDLFFLAPKFGGHVGFTTFASKYYWNEQKILQFINAPMDFADRHRILSD